MLTLIKNRKQGLTVEEVSGIDSLEGFTPYFTMSNSSDEVLEDVKVPGSVVGAGLAFELSAAAMNVDVGYYDYEIVIVSGASIVQVATGQVELVPGVYRG